MFRDSFNKRASYQNIALEEGASHIARYLREKSKLPARAQTVVLDAATRLENCIWIDSQVKSQAKNSVLALLHSINNDLTTQAELHAKDVSAACNYNIGVRAVQLLESRGGEVKLFGVVEQEGQGLEIQGQGFVWKLTAIEESNKAVPREFLENLSILRQSNITPDDLYIASPCSEARPSFKEVVKADVRQSQTKIKEAATKSMKSFGRIRELAPDMRELGRTIREVREWPDPLLICGFGKGPVYLVQIGKWE